MVPVSSYPKIGNFDENLPKVSGHTAEIPVLEETIGGDGFDHHCAVGLAPN